MEKKQKQSLDLRPGKRFGVGLSNENLRIGADSAWEAKIAGNIQRDKHNHQLLSNQGWRVIEIWECQLKRSVVDNTLQNLVLQIIG